MTETEVLEDDEGTAAVPTDPDDETEEEVPTE